MALRASSSCTQAVTNRLTSTTKTVDHPSSHPHGLVPLPAQPKFEGSGLRRTKSRKPVKSNSTKALNASARDSAVSGELHSLESAVTQTFEEIATTSGEILDAVDSVIEEGPAAAMGRRRSTTGRTNSSRTSRRRALVMCLALGMVRPCASNMASNLQQSNNDLRRTVSEFIPRTASASLQVPTTLMSQVSLATSLKQTNLLGGQEDLQKLTTLQ